MIFRYSGFRHKWLAINFLMCFVLITCVGCGGSDDPRQYRVSGSVTYSGKPVPTGAVVFEPDVKQGNSGPAGHAPINDGRYDTRMGQGIVGGPHVVRISGTDGKPDDLGLFPSGAPLFREHVLHIDFPNQESTHDFEVPE